MIRISKAGLMFKAIGAILQYLFNLTLNVEEVPDSRRFYAYKVGNQFGKWGKTH